MKGGTEGMNEKIKAKLKKFESKKARFVTGILMQVFQAALVTAFVAAQLDWSWFKIEYAYNTIGVIILLGYNIGSWYLIIAGSSEERE